MEGRAMKPSPPIKMQPHTYTVSIGNSDDKLSQKRWSDFIDGLGLVLANLEISFPGDIDIHFFGFSNPAGQWQTTTAVFNAPATRDVNDEIRGRLANLAAKFDQDSIAVTVGTTTFVRGQQ